MKYLFDCKHVCNISHVYFIYPLLQNTFNPQLNAYSCQQKEKNKDKYWQKREMHYS